MKRLTWPEMRTYWETHSSRWSQIDLDRDPDGLGNVCRAGAPAWLNGYHARFQRVTFEWLFDRLPPPRLNPFALDVGCGAGRWSRLLHDHGYQSTGIDLQPELIDRDRIRYPNIRFEVTSIQEFEPDQTFDLITSVTVLQHIPFADQDIALRKLRAMIEPGGHFIVLENTSDQEPHVFSRSIESWQSSFRSAGFQTLLIRRYDYSPLTRLLSWVGRAVEPPARGSDGSPLGSRFQRMPSTGRLTRLSLGLLRLAVGIDQLLEPVMIRSNLRVPTGHCGFLLRAIDVGQPDPQP